MGTKNTKKKSTTKKTTTKKPSLNKKVAKKIQSKKVADPVEKKITIVCLAASVVVVAASLFVGVFFNPEKIAKRKMEYLVADYYENYFYDNFVETIEGDSDKIFGEYAEIGFAPVYLRQLLLYDNRKHDDFNKYFTTKNYTCNKNVTRAQIFPVAPYGKTDYKVNYTYSCNYE